MRFIPTRPRRPDFRPELVAELELVGREQLRRLRYERGPPGPEVPEIRLLRRSIKRVQLEEWIAWKEADRVWRDARLYWVTMIGAIAAVIAALAGILAAFEGWH